MAKIISFINYKGGVGKTTTTFHIGCALARFEPKKKVLLIDADPQTNPTFLCCVNFGLFRLDAENAVALWDSPAHGDALDDIRAEVEASAVFYEWFVQRSAPSKNVACD
ncbi:MAG TPA: hypothetical protein DIT76_03350 [Spartobacteria bacterium]|jgi:cellulose biosynthesis protein BcsQ|nr:hypothetical protein [Spartobacteria bacterium]HAF15275.1 hypothetical protein [Blastocatellia bacterium]HCP91073.1 hypothetical protein [Spartobacteria bacterium]